MQNSIEFSQIGVIHSPFLEAEGTPIQSAVAGDVEGRIELFPAFAPGLADVEGFSHLIILFHCHKAGESKLKVIPFMDDQERGVFSTRAPRRPNAIGFSIVELLGIEGNVLRVRGLDMLDGSPLLDIKPYIPDVDCRKAERVGWLEGRTGNFSNTEDDGRFV